MKLVFQFLFLVLISFASCYDIIDFAQCSEIDFYPIGSDNFAVAWSIETTPSSDNEIWVQTYTHTGTPLTSAVLVDSNNVHYPRLAALTSGDFGVYFHTEGAATTDFAIYHRLCYQDGSPCGTRNAGPTSARNLNVYHRSSNNYYGMYNFYKAPNTNITRMHINFVGAGGNNGFSGTFTTYAISDYISEGPRATAGIQATAFYGAYDDEYNQNCRSKKVNSIGSYQGSANLHTGYALASCQPSGFAYDATAAFVAIHYHTEYSLYISIHDGFYFVDTNIRSSELQMANPFGVKLDNGNILVLWEQYDEEGVSTIIGKVYDFSLDPQSEEYRVSREGDQYCQPKQLRKFSGGDIGLLYLKDVGQANQQGVFRTLCNSGACTTCESSIDCVINDPLSYCDTDDGLCKVEVVTVTVGSTIAEICEDGFLRMSVNSDQGATSMTFSATSTLGDTDLLAELNEYLASINVIGDFTIPSSYLEPLGTYTFTAKSFSVGTTTLAMVTQDLFSLSESSATLSAGSGKSFVYSIGFGNCVPSSELIFDWSQTAGPVVALADYVMPNGIVNVPPCELELSTTYSFEIDIYFDADDSETKTFTLNLEVTDATFTPVISVNSVQPPSENLTALARLTEQCSTPENPDDIMYKWECQIGYPPSGPFEDCDNSDDLFGGDFEPADSVLLFLNKYFEEGQLIRLKAEVEIESIVQATDWVEVFVSENINMTLSNPKARCGLFFFADVDDSEAETVRSFSWSHTSTSSDEEKKEQINKFLSKITQHQLILPEKYIEPEVRYDFYFYYSNYKGENITGKYRIQNISPFPEVTFYGGEEQEFLEYEQNLVIAQTDCMPDNIEASWSQSSGPVELSLQAIQSSDHPNILKIPRCKLEGGQAFTLEYILKDTITLDQQVTEFKFSVAQSDDFRVHIQGGDVQHSENKDLNLDAQIIFESLCNDDSDLDFTYNWSCSKHELLNPEFEACDDDNAIFGSDNTYSTLTIPNSYFENQDWLYLTVLVTNPESGLTAEATTIVKIGKADSINIEIKCKESSYLPCFVFSPSKEYQLEAKTIQKSSSSFNYFWTLEPNFPFNFYRSALQTTPLLTSFDYTSSMVTFAVTVSNSDIQSNAEYVLPLNYPPSQGSLYVTPASGQAFLERFTLQAYSWYDENLPLSYSFSAKSADENSFRPLSDIQRSEKLSTLLSSPTIEGGTGSTVTVRAEIYDKYYSTTVVEKEVSIFNPKITTNQAIDIAQSLVSSLEYYSDPVQTQYELAQVTRFISSFENSIVQGADTCDCFEHGACQDGQCLCQADYTLRNCQLSNSQFDTIIANKIAILDIIKKNQGEFQSNETVLNVITDVSSSSQVNINEVQYIVKQILDEILNLEKSSKISSVKEAEQASQIYDNFLKYSAEKDCDAEGDFTLELEQDTLKYLNKIEQAFADKSLPNSPEKTISNSHFSAYVKKLTECSIAQQKFSIGAQAPELEVQLNGVQDCQREVLVSYFAFNDDLFNCEMLANLQDINKNVIMLKIQDAVTGQDLSQNYDVLVTKADQCDTGCKSVGDKACRCGSESSIFNIEEQIERVFEKTNLKKLASIDFSTWEVYNSGPFWFSLGLGALCAGQYFVIKKKLKDFCIVEKVMKSENPTMLQTILGLFVMVHPLLNVFFVNIIKPSKPIRVGLFYCRLLMILALVSILGSNTGLNIGRALQGSVSLSVDVYILLLPYFTFVPLEFALRALLSERETKTTKQKLIAKILKIAGIILAAFFIIGCFFIIIAISESSSGDENRQTLGLFGKQLILDWTLTPLLILIILYAIQDDNMTEILAHQSSPQKRKSTREDREETQDLRNQNNVDTTRTPGSFKVLNFTEGEDRINTDLNMEHGPLQSHHRVHFQGKFDEEEKVQESVENVLEVSDAADPKSTEALKPQVVEVNKEYVAPKQGRSHSKFLKKKKQNQKIKVPNEK